MRRRDLTLIEVVIALVIAAGIALIVGAATQTATFMGREVAVANAVADMATEIGDELEARFVMANSDSPIDFAGTQAALRPTPHAGLTALPPGITAPLAAYRTRPSLTFRQKVGLTPTELWALDQSHSPATTVYEGVFGGAGSGSPPAHQDPALNDPPFPDDRVATVIDGVRISQRQFIENGFVRFRWVPTDQPRVYDVPAAPGRMTEAYVGRDLNGGGVATETYEAGYIVIEFLDDTGAVSTTTFDRMQFGGDGPVRVLWNGEGGTAPNPPLPAIFGHIGDSTSTDVFTTPVNLATQKGFQLNLLVIHDPIAGAGGREVATVFNYQRIISAR